MKAHPTTVIQRHVFENAKKRQEQFHTATPFKHIHIPDFLETTLYKKLLTQLLELQFQTKKSDLFQFKQSADLTTVKNGAIAALVQTLYSPQFIEIMQTMSGLKLSKSTIDIAATLYQDTDYLLCHDDELEGRAIAFLLYLTTMEKSDGGALALFEQQKGLPTKVTKRIRPIANSFAFFHVSPISFHSVEEVISQNPRIAIGGWYHVAR